MSPIAKSELFGAFKSRAMRLFCVSAALLGWCFPSAADWEYTGIADPQTNQLLRIATSKSLSWEGVLMVRLSPEGGANIVLGTKNAIVCADPCRVRIAFDGKDSGMREARHPGTIKNMLYLSPRDTPLKMVKSAKRIEVEIKTQDFGWRVMQFDTANFDLDRLNRTQ